MKDVSCGSYVEIGRPVMWNFGRPQQVVAWIRVVLGEMVRTSENVRNIFGNRIDRP